MPNYWVVPASSGKWIVKPEGGPAIDNPPASFDDALVRARHLIADSGGGHLIVIEAGGNTYQTPVAPGQTGLDDTPLARDVELGALERSRRRRAL